MSTLQKVQVRRMLSYISNYVRSSLCKSNMTYVTACTQSMLDGLVSRGAINNYSINNDNTSVDVYIQPTKSIDYIQMNFHVSGVDVLNNIMGYPVEEMKFDSTINKPKDKYVYNCIGMVGVDSGGKVCSSSIPNVDAYFVVNIGFDYILYGYDKKFLVRPFEDDYFGEGKYTNEDLGLIVESINIALEENEMGH